MWMGKSMQHRSWFGKYVAVNGERRRAMAVEYDLTWDRANQGGRGRTSM